MNVVSILILLLTAAGALYGTSAASDDGTPWPPTVNVLDDGTGWPPPPPPPEGQP